MIDRRSVLAAACAALISAPALAGDAWTEIRPELFGTAVPTAAPGVVALAAPYRTHTDPRTEVGATIRAPLGEFVTKVWLIIDDNPMPVSAVFEMAEPVREFDFAGTMRINGPTPVRVVVRTDAGHLYMDEAFLKTSGVGACAAPPGTDPAVAMKTLGRMELDVVKSDAAKGTETAALASRLTVAAGGAATGAAASLPVNAPALPSRQVELAIRHPSHSGMQMDQITLLYIPMRYIEKVEVSTGDRPLFTMTGSISLSEDPAIRFSVPDDAARLDVKLTDTEGATFEKSFPLISG